MSSEQAARQQKWGGFALPYQMFLIIQKNNIIPNDNRLLV
jgi:hypothetical protein